MDFLEDWNRQNLLLDRVVRNWYHSSECIARVFTHSCLHLRLMRRKSRVVEGHEELSGHLSLHLR